MELEEARRVSEAWNETVGYFARIGEIPKGISLSSVVVKGIPSLYVSSLDTFFELLDGQVTGASLEDDDFVKLEGVTAFGARVWYMRSVGSHINKLEGRRAMAVLTLFQAGIAVRTAPPMEEDDVPVLQDA